MIGEASIKYQHTDLSRISFCLIGGGLRTTERSIAALLGTHPTKEIYKKLVDHTKTLGMPEFHQVYAHRIEYFAMKTGKYVDGYIPHGFKQLTNNDGGVMDVPFATSLRLPGKEKLAFIIAADTSLKKGCLECMALGIEWPFSYHRATQPCFVRDLEGTRSMMSACEFTQRTLKGVIPRAKVTQDHHPNPTVWKEPGSRSPYEDIA